MCGFGSYIRHLASKQHLQQLPGVLIFCGNLSIAVALFATYQFIAVQLAHTNRIFERRSAGQRKYRCT